MQQKFLREPATSCLYPVILSGGSGTRLWPLSRAMYPKQFVRFSSDQEASFLVSALKRLATADGISAPIIIGNSEHRFILKEEAEQAGINPKAIVLEPVGRNTAPAIAVAAQMVASEDPTGVLVVMPSDHVIGDVAAFVGAVHRAAKVAASGKLVLFGMKPDKPETGYGYIRRGLPIPAFDGVFSVDAFVEKPDAETAEDYVTSGDYFWNSGIFVLHARTFLDELARIEPQISSAAIRALAGSTRDVGCLRLEPQAFAASPAISIDYAVMERTDKAAVLPVEFGWSDVGSWSSLWSLAEQDSDGNAVQGDAILDKTSNCYVHSRRALVATIGVKDLVIVDTPDALLVADRTKSQDVAGIVARLKQTQRKEHLQHLRNHRPWGFFESLSVGPRFQVKMLHVKPGGKLSLQMHHHRSEHWVVVHGTAKVTIGNTETLVRENESAYIFATQWHRLENPGKTPLELIEVQIGAYLGEDDIVRSDDVYKRAGDETR